VSAEVASGRGGTFWALVPVALLSACVIGIGTLATIASRDPGFSLEKDYYQRAVHWDREQAQWAANARLGYHVALSLGAVADRPELVLTVADRAGAPLPLASVSVEGFPNARAGERRTFVLARSEDGSFRAPLEHARPGLWEFRITVQAGGERYTETVRRDVTRGAAP
jgi:nitrogen fixation protein FixH